MPLVLIQSVCCTYLMQWPFYFLGITTLHRKQYFMIVFVFQQEQVDALSDDKREMLQKLLIVCNSAFFCKWSCAISILILDIRGCLNWTDQTYLLNSHINPILFPSDNQHTEN